MVLQNKRKYIDMSNLMLGDACIHVLFFAFAAMLHCGLGPEQMITLFSTMNMPKIKSDRVHFRSKATGFSDSLPIFRQKFPQMKTYSQSEILQEQYDAHNAKEDVSLLYKLISTNATRLKILPAIVLLQNIFFNISNS